MRARKFHRHPAVDALSRDYGSSAYAVELSTGVVKVGSSRNPRGRLQKLTRWVAWNMQATIVRVHVGAPVPCNVRAIERSVLIALRKVAAPVHGKEFFRGVAFDDAVRLIEAASAAARNQLAESA